MKNTPFAVRGFYGSSGFTIVELLIVIVVIAILAAITLVAYSGITQRARDASLQATASQVEKLSRVNQAGEFDGFILEPSDSGFPATREAFIAQNHYEVLSSRLCIVVYDACYPSLTSGMTPLFDKEKVYIQPGLGSAVTVLSISYWSSQKARWLNIYIYTEATNEDSHKSESACAPFTDDSHFDPGCVYRDDDVPI